MAWIEGTEETTLEVDAPTEEVVAFFCDPAKFKAAFTEMEESEEIEPWTWKWTLVEKAEKGIKYQAVYTVKYTKKDNVLTWSTVEGNMTSTGRTEVLSRGGKTIVNYKETISTDLPIPKLAAKIFRPIVAREIRKGVGSFLERAKEACENG